MYPPEFLSKFPLRIGHPGQGKFFALRWSTHNTGNSLILSRTSEGLGPLFDRTPRDAVVKNVWHFETVNLPEELRALHAQNNAENAVRHVRSILAFNINRLKLTLDLPRCPGWAPYGKEDSEGASWDTDHEYCRACIGGYVFAADDATMYEALCAEYSNPGKHYPDFSHLPRPEGALGESTYAVTTDFGHHSEGIRIVPLEDEADVTDLPENRVLMIISGGTVAVPPSVSDVISRRAEAAEAAKAAMLETRTSMVQEREMENANAIARLVYLVEKYGKVS